MKCSPFSSHHAAKLARGDEIERYSYLSVQGHTTRISFTADRIPTFCMGIGNFPTRVIGWSVWPALLFQGEAKVWMGREQLRLSSSKESRGLQFLQPTAGAVICQM